MASARAAPRASSRSRQSLPVAERATPRNAGGNSTGKADAGSVMMLSIDGHVSRRCHAYSKHRAPDAARRASDAPPSPGPSTEEWVPALRRTAELERFQAKWVPVRVKKTRQNKK